MRPIALGGMGTTIRILADCYIDTGISPRTRARVAAYKRYSALSWNPLNRWLGDLGSIMVPDRALQRQKKPSVTLVFCKLRPSFSLSRQRSRVRTPSGVVPLRSKADAPAILLKTLCPSPRICEWTILRALPVLSDTKRGWCGSSQQQNGSAWDLWQNHCRRQRRAFAASP